MSNWYYYDSNGQKQGLVTGGQLKWLAKNGKITPETMVETEDGKTAPARKVKGLTFTTTAQPETPPSGEPNPFSAPPPLDNPFTGVPPVSDNPFAATVPLVHQTQPLVAQPTIPSTPPVQYALTSHSNNPLSMILLVGLLVVGMICFGVGAYAILWGMTRTLDNVIIHQRGGRDIGTAREMIGDGEYARRIVKSTANDAYRSGTVFLVIAGIAFAGAYVVFIRFVKRKQE